MNNAMKEMLFATAASGLMAVATPALAQSNDPDCHCHKDPDQTQGQGQSQGQRQGQGQKQGQTQSADANAAAAAAAKSQSHSSSSSTATGGTVSGSGNSHNDNTATGGAGGQSNAQAAGGAGGAGGQSNAQAAGGAGGAGGTGGAGGNAQGGNAQGGNAAGGTGTGGTANGTNSLSYSNIARAMAAAPEAADTGIHGIISNSDSGLVNCTETKNGRDFGVQVIVAGAHLGGGSKSAPLKGAQLAECKAYNLDIMDKQNERESIVQDAATDRTKIQSRADVTVAGLKTPEVIGCVSLKATYLLNSGMFESGADALKEAQTECAAPVAAPAAAPAPAPAAVSVTTATVKHTHHHKAPAKPAAVIDACVAVRDAYAKNKCTFPAPAPK